MPEKNPVPHPGRAIRCSFCPCGHVCLRWSRSLLLHFNQGEVVCALDCLREVLREQSGGFSLGAGSFSACYASDGYYYLVCQDHVVLRLSEDEARILHSELVSAQASMGQISQSPSPLPVM